jgi:hypothetical protein
MIKRHVKENDQKDSMIAEAKAYLALGEELARRGAGLKAARQ